MSEPRDLLACVAGFGRSMQQVFDPQCALPALRTPQALRPDRVTTARGACRATPVDRVFPHNACASTHDRCVSTHTPIRFSNVNFAPRRR